MAMPSHNAIVHRLSTEFGYPPWHVHKSAGRLENLPSPLREAFAAWWDTGVFPTLAVEGYTIQRLVTEYGFKAPGAFIMLGWLSRSPDEALRALTHGFDRVVVHRGTVQPNSD